MKCIVCGKPGNCHIPGIKMPLPVCESRWCIYEAACRCADSAKALRRVLKLRQQKESRYASRA